MRSFRQPIIGIALAVMMASAIPAVSVPPTPPSTPAHAPSSRPGPALTEARRSVRLHPLDPQAHLTLALALDKAGEHSQEEEAELLRALQLDPHLAAASDALGVLYARTGRLPLALHAFRNATEAAPGDSSAWLHWGIMLATQRRYAEAIEKFQTAVRIAPGDPPAWTALGMAAGKDGNASLSLAAMRHAAQLQPDSADTHVNLAIALADAAQPGQALDELNYALRLAPQLASAHANRARVLSLLGRNAEARQEAENSVQEAPQNPDNLYLLAELETDPAKAIPFLRQATKAAPVRADIHALLAQELQRAGERSAAIAEWRQTLRLQPDLPEALYGLGHALQQAHDPDAQQYLDRFHAAQQRQQTLDRVLALGNAGLSATQSGQWQAGLNDLDQAIQICGSCPEQEHLHKDLGLVLCSKGDRQKCVTELRRAYALDPHDPDVVRSLQILKALPSAPETAHPLTH